LPRALKLVRGNLWPQDHEPNERARPTQPRSTAARPA